MPSARKCRWCSRQPCPYESNEAFTKQMVAGGMKWLREMPCWEPFPENIGLIHDENGNMLVPEPIAMARLAIGKCQGEMRERA